MSSTGWFDVGDQRLAAAPIRGWASELEVISALVTAVAQGRGGVLVIEVRRASGRAGC